MKSGAHVALVALCALLIAGPTSAATSDSPPHSPSPSPKTSTQAKAPAPAPSPKTSTSPLPKSPSPKTSTTTLPKSPSPGLSPAPTKLTTNLTTACPTLLDLIAKDNDYKWLSPAFPKGALGPVTLLLPLNGTHAASASDYVIPGGFLKIADLVKEKTVQTLGKHTIRIVENKDGTVLAEFEGSIVRPIIPDADIYGKCAVYLLDDVVAV